MGELLEEGSNNELPLKDSVGGQKIVQFINNVIPKAFLPLEIFLNANDVFVNVSK